MNLKHFFDRHSCESRNPVPFVKMTVVRGTKSLDSCFRRNDELEAPDTIEIAA